MSLDDAPDAQVEGGLELYFALVTETLAGRDGGDLLVERLAEADADNGYAGRRTLLVSALATSVMQTAYLLNVLSDALGTSPEACWQAMRAAQEAEAEG